MLLCTTGRGMTGKLPSFARFPLFPFFSLALEGRLVAGRLFLTRFFGLFDLFLCQAGFKRQHPSVIASAVRAGLRRSTSPCAVRTE